MKNQKSVTAIFTAILIVFGTSMSGYANITPVFTDGTSTTRSIAENTAAGTNIGTPIAATDADNDTLTYSLNGTDAASFSIVSTTGQLQTSAALDYETQTSYSVTVSVSDDNGGSDSITVTIDITDVSEKPVFAPGGVILTVAENTASGTNIGDPFQATDPDSEDTLTYSLERDDAGSFRIDPTTGQLQTHAALDYETKRFYTDLAVRATDSTGLVGSIRVTINVTDVNGKPTFAPGGVTLTVAENTVSGRNIGDPFQATDPDSGDTLTYSLERGDAGAFRIDPNTGQLQTHAALDYETKRSYTDLAVRATDSTGSMGSILVTIHVTDVNEAPSFTDGASTTRSIAENTASGQNIGTAVAATDVDGDVLIYTLDGTDASSFSVVRTTGQLQTSGALDYETKSSYAVTVSVSDGSLTDSIDVTITVTDVVENNAPVFPEGSSTTRSVAENTASGTNIGSAIAATDADNDTLIYTLGGTDASSFRIVSTSGQLQTNVALDYETQTSYAVTVSVSDGNGGSDSIPVTIDVTDVREKPSFAPGGVILTVAENTVSGRNIGNPITATDPDSGDTLTYSLQRGDAGAFRIDPNTGQLQTHAALDYETKRFYTDLAVRATDSTGLVGSTRLTINVTDVAENSAPVFTEGSSATRTIAENTASGQNIGSAVAATDADNDTLTYRLGGTDATAFSIVSTTGQLQTNAALDYEVKTSYSVTISVSDGNGGSDSITVTIDVTDVSEKPSFAPGGVTLTVAENTVSGTDIGDPITATDPDSGDTLTYSLQRRDSWRFRIDPNTGQVRTHAALNYEIKRSYTDLAVRATDSTGLVGSTLVRINVTDVTEAELPITPPLSERTPAVRDAIVAYAIAAKWPGVSNVNDVTGEHLAVIKELNLWKSISSLKVGDFNGLTGLFGLQLHQNSISDISALEGLPSVIALYLQNNSISDISALEGLTSLRYLNLTDNSISDISALEGLTSLKSLQLYGNSIGDISVLEGMTSLGTLYLGGKALISDISVLEGMTSLRYLGLEKTLISDISVLEGMTSLERLFLKGNKITDISVLEGMTSLEMLFLRGNPISDYGPLHRLKAAIEVIEDHPGLTLDITILAVPNPNNNAPTFTDGTSTTRSIAESTASGENIGTAVSATDADTGDTLTYHLGGADAASFGIVRTSGQLQTKAALDYETKTSYTVKVAVSDGKGGTDSITVTIDVTDVVNAAPSLQTSLVIPESTSLLTNFPNPFNPETWIPYQLAEPAEVTLTIYNMRGVVVRQLKLGHQPAGIYTRRSQAIHWDGRNEVGETVATGVYFYTLTVGDFNATRKMLIVK